MVATLPAKLGTQAGPLPLLPSGPGGVRCLTLRGNRQGHHNATLDEYQVGGKYMTLFRILEQLWIYFF